MNSSNVLNKIEKYGHKFIVEELGYRQGIKVTKIKDVNANLVSDVKFSINSKIRNAPLLINSSQATSFIYKVKDITSKQAIKINAIDTQTKIKDRISKIVELDGKIEYYGMNHNGFQKNLILIDSKMPEIIGNMLLYFYTEDVKDCDKLIDMLGKRDPLNYGDAMMYTYKFKKFLCSCVLGMKPVKEWDGLDEANGGHIIVKSNGEILAYHIYNRNFFEQYLLDNTIFEKVSTSKHDYMSLYEENGEMFIKMNLQVRFR